MGDRNSLEGNIKLGETSSSDRNVKSDTTCNRSNVIGGSKVLVVLGELVMVISSRNYIQ